MINMKRKYYIGIAFDDNGTYFYIDWHRFIMDCKFQFHRIVWIKLKRAICFILTGHSMKGYWYQDGRPYHCCRVCYKYLGEVKNTFKKKGGEKK